MKSFLQRFGSVITGVLKGFDRLFLRGTLRNLAYKQGLQHYLWANRILYKDFDQHSEHVTEELERASLRHAQELGREVRYLNSSKISPEQEARAIMQRDQITTGLICVLRRVEPCMSFAIHKNRATKKLEIRYRERRCLHLYHYQIHPVFGFMHARIQTWFPFRVYVCINGHEWLARQMDQAGLRYRRYDNGFTWLEDVAQAQALFDQQLRVHWPTLLNDLAATLNPIHDTLFAQYPTHYYWSLAQSEWSTDILFRSRADLEAIYMRLIRHALTTFSTVDILRFFGRKIPAAGRVPASFRGDSYSDLELGEDGVCLRHWLNHNKLKMYDKWSILRPELTINNPTDFWVFRPKEGDADGPKGWRRMRLGIADLYRRAEVSQAANERYLEALAALSDATPLRRLVEPLCQPVVEPAPRHAPVQPQRLVDDSTAEETAGAPPAPTPVQELTPVDRQQPLEIPTAKNETAGAQPAPTPVQELTSAQPEQPSRRRRVRALNPLAAGDSALLEAVSRHEFLINGLRNRDLRSLLYSTPAADKAEERRRSAAVSRKLRLLRAHGLIRKVPKTHRYMVGTKGRQVMTALLAIRDVNTDFLTTNAA
jgi:hypothetical protein